MQMSSSEIGIILPAFLAGLLILSTHVSFGREILARGIIFIDLAIAQIAALGVIIAFSADIHEGWQIQIAAGCAALTGAVALYWAERLWPDVQEAIIGVAFVVASSVGLLLMANHPQGSEHIKDVLTGQVLWVEFADLIPVALLYTIIMLLHHFLLSQENRLLFYLLFAVTITASVQLVGVFLVFASLILPALAVYRMSPRVQLSAGYLLGGLSYMIGLLLASVLDLPAGPMIVIVMAALSFSVLLIWRQ